MKILYAKTLLYTYPVIDSIIEQTDELIEKKALSSMENYSPALCQYESIINLIKNKDEYINLKLLIEKQLNKLTKEEYSLISYKYFHLKPQQKNSLDIGLKRNYFRKQNKVVEKFTKLLSDDGITDEKFEKLFIKFDFIKDILKHAKEHDEFTKAKTIASMLVKSKIIA